MGYFRAAFLAVSLAACASAPQAKPITPAPVIAAERAFAGRAAEVGWVQAFRAFVAPDGVMLTSGPVSAAEVLADTEDTGDTSLAWWPAYAGIARSGDFGFTTGPVQSGDNASIRLHYFTVWRRQSDGVWKWIFDGGVGAIDPTPIPRNQAHIPTLAAATGGAGSAAAAIAQVRNVERMHATAASLQPFLAGNARVNRQGLAPGVTTENAAALFAHPTLEIDYTPLRAEASSAGDLVMTINEARFAVGGADKRGHAVRIWQWQSGDWRIVFDELVPARPPA